MKLRETNLHSVSPILEVITVFTEASLGLWVLLLPASVCVCVCVRHPELVHTITHHVFKLEPSDSQNLDKNAKHLGKDPY